MPTTKAALAAHAALSQRNRTVQPSPRSRWRACTHAGSRVAGAMPRAWFVRQAWATQFVRLELACHEGTRCASRARPTFVTLASSSEVPFYDANAMSRTSALTPLPRRICSACATGTERMPMVRILLLPVRQAPGSVGTLPVRACLPVPPEGGRNVAIAVCAACAIDNTPTAPTARHVCYGVTRTCRT